MNPLHAPLPADPDSWALGEDLSLLKFEDHPRIWLRLRWLSNLNSAGHNSLQLYNCSSSMVRPETVVFTWSTSPSHLILSFSSSLPPSFSLHLQIFSHGRRSLFPLRCLDQILSALESSLRVSCVGFLGSRHIPEASIAGDSHRIKQSFELMSDLFSFAYDCEFH